MPDIHVRSLTSGLRTFARRWRSSGPRAAVIAVARRVARGDGSVKDSILVGHEESLVVDWTDAHPAVTTPHRASGGPLHLAWVTSPPGAESGGHQNIWRFIELAEAAGHRCSIYLYDASGTGPMPEAVRSTVSASVAFANVKANIYKWQPASGVGPGFDAILATSWETAYAAYRDPSPARRLYFVQDFEPMFFPVGSLSTLAENTYRFGFHGITAGGWLAKELHQKFGMSTDHFDFAADTSRYACTNTGERKGVFFYARPMTPRRAYELGLLALEAFHAQRPDAQIHFAGSAIESAAVPFPHQSHGSLSLDNLAPLYNKCASGLVLSLTNLSLLPLELLAAGVTPVLNDAPNNRLVANNPRFGWAPLNPQALARALVEAYDANLDSSSATANSAAAQGHTWADSGLQFVDAVERHVRS